MKIEFDSAKRDVTLENRNLDFAQAGKIFEGKTLTILDDRQDYGEARLQTIGWLEERLVMVVWTPRGEARRIISMRKCNAQEHEKFRELVGGPG